MIQGSQGKYVFTIKNFYLQGILNDINEQDTSFLILNTNMMNNRAPPDKFGVLHSLLPIEVHSFTSRIDF